MKRNKQRARASRTGKQVFQFGWDEAEDTAAEAKIYGVQKINLENHIMFGKGKLGGYDNDVMQKLQSQKDLEIENKPIQEMDERDWRIFKENNEIIVKGYGTYVSKPIRSWKDLQKDIPEQIFKNIKNLGFNKPTAIQMQAIPIGQQMRDMLANAPTGSGKSFAFLLPIISLLFKLPPVHGLVAENGPYSLIMAPTRELAQQIELEFQKLTQNTRLRSVVVVGGKSAQQQGSIISSGVEIVIGTPGRIEDFLNQRLLVLNQCYSVVLDEADKMIEMDLEESVNNIISFIPESIQKNDDAEIANHQEQMMIQGKQFTRMFMMFSATILPEVEKLAQKYLRHHLYVQIGQQRSAKKEIQQKIEFINGGEQQKKKVLAKILNKFNKPPIIIFVNQKVDTEILEKYIQNDLKIKCSAFHGSKTQEKREAALENLRNGKVDIIVCTNVAARGIDIDSVQHVINYDAPSSIVDYIHRIGRTGRAGKQGMATTFLTPEDQPIYQDLRKYLQENDQHVPQELQQILNIQ